MAASSRAESKMYTASYSRDNAAILLWSFRPPRVASAGGGWLPRTGVAGQSHYLVTVIQLSPVRGAGQRPGRRKAGNRYLVIGHWSLAANDQRPMTNDGLPAVSPLRR